MCVRVLSVALLTTPFWFCPGCGPLGTQAALPGGLGDPSADAAAVQGSGGGGGPRAEIATTPSPANGATNVSVVPALTWTAGHSATRFDVFVGTVSAEVQAAGTASILYQGSVTTSTFSPRLAPSTTYYWRVDSFAGNGQATTGPIWTLTTAPAPGTVADPSPGSSATNVATNVSLVWGSAANATSYGVYFGESEDAVSEADPSAPEYRGSQAVARYGPQGVQRGQTYYWRIDANGPGGTTPGPVWSFTTVFPLTAPNFWPELEVTDAAAGHVVGPAPNIECSNTTRVGDKAYVLYRANFTTQGDRLYVRPIDLTSRTMLPVVQVDALTDEAINGYHSEPTLIRDGGGRLHVLNQYFSYVTSCWYQYGIAPRHGVIPDLFSPTTWLTPGCLPSRLLNIGTSGSGGAQFYDAMAIYDDRTGFGHCVGQSYGLRSPANEYEYGFPRTYYRFQPDGGVDGPYVLVHAAQYNDSATSAAGGVYAKGDLVLGKEASGPRSLHLVWNTRILFTDVNGTHWWNYDLYYARSSDGGQTWQSLDGSASVPLEPGLQWNDTRYRVYAGDVNQDSERAFDVDRDSNPFIAVLKHRPGTGPMYGGHVDVYNTTTVEYDLTYLYFRHGAWRSGVINNTLNWRGARPRVRVDADNNIYIFAGTPLRYYRSADGGQTWTGPVAFGEQAGNAQRLYSAPDPLDENYHDLVYPNAANNKLYFLRMQLTNR